MKCTKCGAEFDEGMFCPECGQKYEELDVQNSDDIILQEISVVDRNIDLMENEGEKHREENIFPVKKKPIILSIPVIFLVGFFTCGIGALIMAIVRLKKYPERKKSNIIILAIWGIFLLLTIWRLCITSGLEMSNSNTLNGIVDSETDMTNKSEEISNNDDTGNVDGKKAKEVTNKVIYETILEWQEIGFDLTELGFPKNNVDESSIFHIEAIYTDKNDSKSDIVAEVEFQEDGYQYYVNFMYGYSEEDRELYAKDIEVCRGKEWVIMQPTDKEILSILIEKEAKDEYDYSDITIEQREQDYTAFMAKTTCTIASSEGIKKADYILTWNWENENWNFNQIQEPIPSQFEPLGDPDNAFITEFISQKEETLLQEDERIKSRIELIEENWDSAENIYSYKFLQIKSAQLTETNQNMEVKIRFDEETGYWDYENVLCQYDDELQKIYTIDGTWEGLEYETFEASWKYVVEILSIDPDNNEITINSWCEFMADGSEMEKTFVCNEEKIVSRNGEYNIHVGGYIVDHTASNGMNFTYKFIVEDGKLFINEEKDVMYLSIQNPEMSIALGVEMFLRE